MGKKKVRKNILKAIAHVNASFNNTMVTITDMNGETLCWDSAAPWASRARARARHSQPRARRGESGDQGQAAWASAKLKFA